MKRTGKVRLWLVALAVLVFGFGGAALGAGAAPSVPDVLVYEALTTAGPAAGGNALNVNGATFKEADGWLLEDVENEINDLLAAGEAVTVKGAWLGIADYSFYFFIPEGVTLFWAADLSGTHADDDFMSILAPWDAEKGGCFVLAGGILEYYGPKACAYFADIDLRLESGVIAAYGDGCRALSHQSGGINLLGGGIRAEGDYSRGVSFWGEADDFRIDGCTITASGKDSYAVYCEGDKLDPEPAYKFVSGRIVGAANINDYIGEMLFALDGWNGGGSGALAASANLIKDTVTVTGNVVGAGAGLDLNIPAGVTVLWEATASAAADFAAAETEAGGVAPSSGLVNLSGAGTFVVSSAGALTAEGGATSAVHTEGVDVVLRGTVKYQGGAEPRGAAVSGAGSVVLDGGALVADGVENYAVWGAGKGGFNYLGGELRGALQPEPGVAYDDYEISFGLRRNDNGKQFSVPLPVLPAGVGAAYGEIRVYPRGAEYGRPTLVNPESVSIAGGVLRFTTASEMPSGYGTADLIDLTVTSYYYQDYHVRIAVGATPEDSLLPRRTPAAQLDFAAERLTGLEPGAAYVVLLAADSATGKTGQMTLTADAGGSLPIEPTWFGERLQLVQKGDRWENSDSAGQILKIPARPGEAGLSGVKGGAGMLVGLNYALEYKLNTAGSWAAATGNSVSGLPLGTYQVRLRATATEFAGEAVEVTLGAELAPGGSSLSDDAAQEGAADPTESSVAAAEAPRETASPAEERQPEQPEQPGQALPQEQLQPEQPPQEQAVQAAPEANPGLFFDVKPEDWYYGDVKYVFENGLMSGVSTGYFEPQGTINWAALLAALYRMDGSPDVSGLAYAYSDVYGGAWYADAVKWAAVNGIVSGFEDGIFSPADIIVSREWLATTFVRYMNYAGIDPPVNDEYRIFADENQIADFAKQAIQTMHKLEIIRGGADQKINPKSIANRAEFAAMLHRLAELK